MPEFLVHKVLVLHSPPVLLPRTARLYVKLARWLGQVPKFLVYRVQVLHSPPVLLPRMARLYVKLARWLGQVPEFLVYRVPVLLAPLGALGIGRMLESLVCGVLILHSPPVCRRALPCLPSFALQNSWIILST